MEYRQLGRSGLRLSVLSLGTLPFGGHQRASVGNVTVDTARRLVDMAIDHGVNMIDTADVYGAGRSEETVGEVIKGRRNRVLLATKLRATTGDGPNESGLSRHHIVSSVEGSLRRLGTDHIDLYQAHGWDGETSIDETMRAFDQLVGDGKVRYTGCANYSAWHVMKSVAAADRLGTERFVSHQIYYSLLDRDAENELVPAAVDQGLGILVWGGLAGGLLSGRYRGPDDNDRIRGWREPPSPDPSRVYAITDLAQKIGGVHGATVAQVSLAYLLARSYVTSILLGPRTEEHFATGLKALDISLTPDDLTRLDEVSAKPRPYPQWHQQWSAADRPGVGDAAANVVSRSESVRLR